MKFFATLLAGILLFIAPTVKVFAQLAPVGEKLARAESANFIYIYPEPLAPRLPALVKACEDAYALLTPVFNWEPRVKTFVLYHDLMDIHNAFATIYPFNLICVYAANTARPDTFDDTLRTTVFHEFTHILSLDAQYGVDAALASVFGRVLPLGDPVSTLLAAAAAPPGQLAPVWYLEGLAMWSETEFTGQGRGRSSLIDMYARMPFVDDNVLSPEQWSLNLPEWPYGNSAYIYGMKTIAYAQSLSDCPDRNIPGELSDSVAHSFLFFFNNRSKPVVDTTFANLADNALELEKKRQESNVELLKTMPLTIVERVTPENMVVYSPKFSADGLSLFFAAKEQDARQTLHQLDLKTGYISKINNARVQAGVSQLAMAPDRNTLYYNRLNIRGRDKIRFELKMYCPETGRARTLTRDGRYRFLAVHPDSSKIAAIRDEAGSQTLVETPVENAGHDEKVLVRAAPGEILLSPVYSPDGKQLVYVFINQQFSSIKSIDLDSGVGSTFLEWPSIILSPAFHPSGRELVFVSDRSGVYNLYRLNMDNSSEPELLTSVPGGIFAPDFSPDGKLIAVQGYDSRGYYAALLDYTSLTGRPVSEAPVIHPDWTPVDGNAEKTAKVSDSPAPSLDSLNPGRYWSFANIRPNFWSPWLTFDSGNAAGGAGAVFSDPAAYQRISLLGGYNGTHNMPIAAFNYGYYGCYPVFSVFGSYDPESYYNLIETARGSLFDYDEKTAVGGSAVTFPLVNIDRDLSLTLGYKFTHHSPITKLPENGGGVVTENIFEGSESALLFDAVFSDAAFFDTSSSLEDGRLVLVSAERSMDMLGGELSRTRCVLNWIEYLSMPWRGNNILRLELLAGTGTGDETAQGLFGLGGFGVSQDVYTPGIESAVGLRGYKSNTQTGRSIIKCGAAYRFPMSYYYKSADATMPLYYHQLFGEVFYEGGRVNGDSRSDDWLNAAGAEVNLALTLFRFVEVSPGIGFVYAFDLDEDSENSRGQLYISIKSIVNF